MHLGNTEAALKVQEAKGELVKIGNECFYKISNVDDMRPFFMSIVSNSNHWMFISSNGGLTAGRKNSSYSLFPYYTDDKITESAENTGNKTVFQVHADGKTQLWEPFSSRYLGIYNVQRNLYKNDLGNKIIFEEINHDLGLTFSYQWNSSDQFGFVKKSTLRNDTKQIINVTLLDGIQNIIPYGVSADLQNAASNLVDAYKKCELETDSGLGIYALSAIIVDKPEPSEALKANIVWSIGLENPTYLLSSLQLDRFRSGKGVQQEVDIKAEKGAYFVSKNISVEALSEKNWMIIANVRQSIVSINEIKELIKKDSKLVEKVLEDIENGSKQLVDLNGASDGLQLTDDQLRNTRHFANTLFNIMRGGIFDNNYQIEKLDFEKYLSKANKVVFQKEQPFLNQLPEVFTHNFLKNSLENSDDLDFIRLALEYMPLKFSRRHGDPSRPWNKFSINTKSDLDGSKVLDYEGNWRDIFQNWEALAHAYPEFIESMIHKFLNASTFEGYNPYRITKDGFDWEIIEPHDPWSFIGYWGDHQIIYLLKFLEFAENHYPKKLASLFSEDLFVYANVPYKIKSYQDILVNPKDTIHFDDGLNSEISKRKEKLGADGALLTTKTNAIYKVNLLEKLLVTVLAKISNFIPEGGIWMNTQRPEWNDANNALVGNGVSMVTLYYLRRFMKFFEEIVSNETMNSVEISQELSEFFHKTVHTLNQNKELLRGTISNAERKIVLDGLGGAGSDYRSSIYQNGFSNKKCSVTKDDLQQFFDITGKFIDHTIAANKREDKLYHAYNLMTVENGSEISISNLPEMLEGQVAALSSGYVSGADSLELLNALKWSALFRRDQYSYVLYPDKELPRFTVKNNIPFHRVEESDLLKRLLTDGNKQIIEKDILGSYHFNGSFNNANALKNALTELPEKYATLVEKDVSLLLNIFEEIFNHKAFTGRSGTFFGYEGLGSIYWHMVSKLLLSVQETCISAYKNNENEVVIGKLLDHYYEINEGIGVHKSPKLFGAFPTDPYSHTPAGKGAQQPGMTGQVKEDILSRFGELGVFVKDGKLQFNPILLRRSEFLSEFKTFNYTDVNQQTKSINIEKDSLCFTYCQVPVQYKKAPLNRLEIVYADRISLHVDHLSLDEIESKKVFERNGEIKQIIVSIKDSLLK